MSDAQAPLLSWLRVAQAVFTAVLITALLGLLFTVVRQLEPVGTISGRLGPVEESRRSTYEATYAVTILTDDNELLLVNLRNHGRILAYLEEHQPNEAVTLAYQDRTAVSLTTAAGQIREYSAFNTGTLFLLIGLCLLLLSLLLFPSFIESRFSHSVA
ncbi:MAG: hypothetical protein KDE51_10745 [Anaerolineales bacterium]|nr:hypothetical protein [Anaerolineales bacterium]